MDTFDRTETITCSLTVATSAGAPRDPDTSTKISIADPHNTLVMTATDMTNAAVGSYWADYTSAATAVLGTYKIDYVAVNAGRTTIQQASFELIARGAV